MVKTGKQNLAFSYKPGFSPVHRMPAVAKLLLIPALNIIVFNLPFEVAVGLILIQTILLSCLRFNFREQFADLKPVLYYAVFLYLSSFIARAFQTDLKEAFSETMANTETLKMLVKLFCMMQGASIIFKTSTTLQLREGINQIETFIRKILPVSKENKFSNILAVFFCFIPMVFRNWEKAKTAWYARGGKTGLRMLRSILPVFFSIGLKQAWLLSKAIRARS